ncbi:photosynthetic complex putative assembly protein PuhB [Brevundimonas sp. R86498]|uniref:photosynthetic complex putative assembly protein PuhB n=1 Tax=Brevundimonas sp. R86498 TaxID=3093845 RepID=UPI0037CC1A83
MSEHAGEPIRGLPGHLPAGEHILWQGAPDWRTLSRSALKAHWVAVYFGGQAVWNVGSQMASGAALAPALGIGVLTLAVGAVAVGLLVLYAWLNARTTVYTLTNKRFVLRHGVALSKCFNIPYPTIAAAGLKVDAKGVGDIPLGLAKGYKVAYPHLWPHARPWRIVTPEPMMRALPEAATVAEMLSRQLQLAARAADKPFVAEAPRAAVEAPARKRRPAGQTAAA